MPFGLGKQMQRGLAGGVLAGTLLGRQAQAQALRVKPAVSKQAFMPAFAQREAVRFGTASLVGVKMGVATEQVFAQKFAFPPPKIAPPIVPTPPPVVPRGGIIPFGFPFPPIGMLDKGGRGKGTGRKGVKTKYDPSIAAIIKGVRARGKPSLAKSWTGIEIRPIFDR